MTSYTVTEVDAMLEKFPAAPEPIRGEPNLVEMHRVLKHMRLCSQTHRTPLSSTNMLFLVLPQPLFAQYTNEPYPTDDANYPAADAIPNLDEAIDAADRETIRVEWQLQNKTHQDVKNMNAALVSRFLSLIEPMYKMEYETALLSTPNPTFLTAFQHFVDAYGQVDSAERLANRKRMGRQWNPATGFEAFIQQITDGIEYAAYAQGPIADSDIVDIAEYVMRECGQYPDIFEKWSERNQADRTWANFKTFWREKLRLRKRVGVPANALGYGMGAQSIGSNDDAIDAEANRQFEESVQNFAAANNATQSSIANLTQTNANLQTNVANQMNMLGQQMNAMQQMMCQLAMNASMPPPAMNQMQFQPQGQQQQRNNNNRQRNRGGYNGGYTQAAQNLPPQFNGSYGTNSNSSNQRNYIKRFENWEYCSTHGGDVPDGHNSMTCTKPGPSHNYYATRQNYMQVGGSRRGMHKNILPSAVGRQGATTNRQRQQQQQPAQQQRPAMPMPMQQPMMPPTMTPNQARAMPPTMPFAAPMMMQPQPQQTMMMPQPGQMMMPPNNNQWTPMGYNANM